MTTGVNTLPIIPAQQGVDPKVGTNTLPTIPVSQGVDPKVGTNTLPTIPEPQVRDDFLGSDPPDVPPIVVSGQDGMGGENPISVHSFTASVFQIRSDPRHHAAQGASINTNPYHAKRSQDFSDTAAYAMSVVALSTNQAQSPVKEGSVYPRARVRGQEGLM